MIFENTIVSENLLFNCKVIFYFTAVVIRFAPMLVKEFF